MRSIIAVTFLLILCSPGFAQTGATEKQSTPKEKIQEAKKLLEEAKLSLKNEGKYDCCVIGACDRCALDHQNCSCATAVKKGKPVCSDCYAGWQHGNGTVPGVDSAKVKLGSHGHKH